MLCKNVYRSECKAVANSSCCSLDSIPVDSYSSSIEQQTSLDRQDLPGSMEQTSMARSQSAPMLDDELGYPGHGASNQNQSGQNQKPAIPHKAYHFDHNYNPQVGSSCNSLACNNIFIWSLESRGVVNSITQNYFLSWYAKLAGKHLLITHPAFIEQHCFIVSGHLTPLIALFMVSTN